MNQKLTLDELKQRCFKKNWDELPLYPKVVSFNFSIRIVKLLHNTSITPNQVTLFSLIIGFFSAIFFSIGNVFTFFLGAIFLEFYYVLDCVDGQLARLKGASSQEGSFIDYLLNYIVHPMIFFAIGLGCYFAGGKILFILAGVISGWATVLGYALSDCKHAVVITSLIRGHRIDTPSEEKTDRDIAEKNNLLKKIFMAMHKVSTYPMIMNTITVTSIIGIILDSMKPIYLIIIAFSINIPIVLVVRTCKIVRCNRISAEYEQIKSKFLVKEGMDE